MLLQPMAGCKRKKQFDLPEPDGYLGSVNCHLNLLLNALLLCRAAVGF